MNQQFPEAMLLQVSQLRCMSWAVGGRSQRQEPVPGFVLFSKQPCPFSWIYASYMDGISPRRPIGLCRGKQNIFLLTLSGFPIPPPHHHLLMQHFLYQCSSIVDNGEGKDWGLNPHFMSWVHSGGLSESRNGHTSVRQYHACTKAPRQKH